MPHVGFTEFRRNLATHLDRVENDRAELVVTRQNHADMVVLPLAELAGMRETLHLLGSPADARRLLKGIERDLIEA